MTSRDDGRGGVAGFGIARLVGVLLAAVLTGGLLAACGSDSSGSGTTPSGSGAGGSTGYVQQDIIFASQLIELEEQAITLANVTSAKSDNPQFEQLSDEVTRSAKERMAQAYALLAGWNASDVQTPPAPGLLTEEQLTNVTISTGAELQQAVNSAVDSQVSGMLAISKAELAGGQNADARQLAQNLEANSAAEMAVLRKV